MVTERENNKKAALRTIVGVAVPGAGAAGISIQANDEKEYLVAGGIDTKQARGLLRKRVKVYGSITEKDRVNFINVIKLDVIPVDHVLTAGRALGQNK